MNLQCKQLRQGYIVILPFDQVTLQMTMSKILTDTEEVQSGADVKLYPYQ